MTTTVIRNADWVVAWDAGRPGHCYIDGADVAWRDGALLHVGRGYAGAADVEIDGRGRMVMPGLVNIHTHSGWEPVRKGLTDEIRSPGFWHSSLYEYLPLFPLQPDERAACLRVAHGELLRSGCTTVVDFEFPYDGWLDAMAESGIRGVAAPWFYDADYRTNDGHSLAYTWDGDEGRRQFELARRTIDLALQHPSGRLSAIVAPGQADCALAETLHEARDFAAERRLCLQIHAAESVSEFHEMQRRHGLSTVQWLDSLGVLGPSMILGHAIILDHHPWLHWTSHRDLALIAERGASVAHCPTVFMRRGISLQTFGGYRRAGVNLGIGTDTYPHNMLDEMRHAMQVARVTAGSVADLEASDVFDAATVGGARALGRDDIGRLAPGARADLVVVDVTHPAMMPAREPLRTLITIAGDRAVRDVFVDGRQVLKQGEPVHLDHRANLEALAQAQARAMADVPSRDWAGRGVDQLMPRMYPVT